MPSQFQEATQKIALNDTGQSPGISQHVSAFSSSRSKLYRSAGKRILDVIVALIAIPLVLPALLPMIILVASDGGSPFYTQTRVGKGGKPYRMWKLRSMVVNADRKLEEYLEANAEAKREWDHTQKLVNDPRITAVGRLLRKSSLDELPQIWNVLRGEMSFVGPRPMMVEQRPIYPGMDYFELRPGITGLWQVSARNESSFADRAKFDAQYNQRLSLTLDLRLIFETFRVVWRATGH